MLINLKSAKKEFKKYVKQYDLSNEKIRLKAKHTLKVMNASKKIAKSLKMEKEDIKLAQIIGLLHDIGRFEQIKTYNTFNDNESVNHGELGIKILFDENLIRKFIKDDKYDSFIRIAIYNHNRLKIQDELSPKELLFAKIIRDADKVDIFRVLEESSIEAIYNCDCMENEEISPDILEDFFENKSINYINRKTNADKCVTYMAYIFDFNFNYSIKIIKKNKCIEKLASRIKFKNPKTIEQFEKILKSANAYMDSRLK